MFTTKTIEQSTTHLNQSLLWLYQINNKTAYKPIKQGIDIVMTPKEATESVGKKVYGFGFDNDPVETLIVVSVEELNPRDKKAKIRTFMLQDPKGNIFKVGINDYYTTELECSIVVNKQIESLVVSSEREIKSLQDTINDYKKKQAKLLRKIKTMTHLESIKTKK